MSFTVFMFAPLVALLPVANTLDPRPLGDSIVRRDAILAEPQAPGDRLIAAEPDAAFTSAPFDRVAESFRIAAANQVRIEQRMTIRIAPRPAPVQRNMLMDLPGRAIGPQFVERKIGKCLPVAGIAGVQADANRLLLFMRDQRIVSAELERACRARDYYSGFYLARSNDGRICVDRDVLLSRSGANCKLSRIRQLVEAED